MLTCKSDDLTMKLKQEGKLHYVQGLVHQDAHRILSQSWDQDTIELYEQFMVLLTNRANQLLCIIEISFGGIAVTVTDPKLIFAAALKAGASGF